MSKAPGFNEACPAIGCQVPGIPRATNFLTSASAFASSKDISMPIASMQTQTQAQRPIAAYDIAPEFPFPWMISALPVALFLAYVFLQRAKPAHQAQQAHQAHASSQPLPEATQPSNWQKLLSASGDEALAKQAITAAIASNPELDPKSDQATDIAIRIAKAMRYASEQH